MKGAVMSKKKGKAANYNESKPPKLVPLSNAPECQMCKTAREATGRANDVFIYCTRDRVRYVKCRVCEHTFKFVPLATLQVPAP